MKRCAVLVVLGVLLGAGVAEAGPRGFVPVKGTAQAPRANRFHFDSATLPLLYHGGPVVRAHSVHILYWQRPGYEYGAAAADTTAFKATLEQYSGDVARASGGLSNAFSVGVQYGDTSGPGAYSASFEGAVTDSTMPYGNVEPGCLDTPTDQTLLACVTEKQIQHELDQVIAAHPDWSGGPPNSHLYFVMLPKGVGSCTVNPSACAYVPGGYCGYHSDYGTAGNEKIYAVLPYDAVPGCDNRERPNGNAADAAVDVFSHEWNESITDPVGTLCPSTGPCAANALPGWFDAAGAENGDKCADGMQPLSGPDSAAGTPIGGTPPSTNGFGTLYNQVINRHPYYTQREYSNLSGRCQQRIVSVSFVAPQSGSSFSFNASASGATDDPVANFSWDFGDGYSGAGQAPSHTYAVPGTYPVRLTVTDTRGNVNSLTQDVTANAPPATPPLPQPSTPSVAPRATQPPPARIARISASSLAGLVGGLRFSLSRPRFSFSLASASCPPACTLQAKLTTRVRSGHRLKTVFVGFGTLRLGAGTSGRLSVRLNAAGRRLLQRRRRLTVTLSVRGVDSQSATAQITRRLTLSLKTRKH